MTTNIEEIVTKLDELIALAQKPTYTIGEMSVALQELVDLIRPQERKFVQVPCSSLDSHNEHLWTRGEYSYYCPGRDFD